MCSKTGIFIFKKSKSLKNYLNVSKLRGKFQKLKKKTQNSRKKLKLWEDFTPPERPSDVIKKSLVYEFQEDIPHGIYLDVITPL